MTMSRRLHHRSCLPKPAVPLAFAVAACSLAILGVGDVALAARAPTALERAAIQQTIFDFFHTKGQVARPRITGISVLTRGAPRLPLGAKNYYAAFARVHLSDRRAGLAAAILGYYVDPPLSGWEVLELGSATVGCHLPAAIFRGFKAAVLRDLKFPCDGIP